MTERKPFTLEALEAGLDLHGSALERWPADMRASAQELLDTSADARALWARAERLAALLDAVPDVLPSAALQARIAALPARHPRGWAAWWPFGNPLAPLLAWGAAAAIGVFVGSSVPGFELEPPEGSPAAFLAEPLDEEPEDSLAGEDWSEIELALGLDLYWEEEP